MSQTRIHPAPVERSGQSLVEFAILLPMVLILIMLIVRVLMILNIWYSVNSAADAGVRAAALTGNTSLGRQIVIENLPGADLSKLDIKFTPAEIVVVRLVTPTPTLIPGKTAAPTATPDLTIALNPDLIPDRPVQIEVTYNVQFVGPMLPEWVFPLTAFATARLEPRVKLTPRDYF